MATRRTQTKVQVPIPSQANGETISGSTLSEPDLLDWPPPGNSPFLPTILESVFLGIYPLTLLLGSLFSFFHPSTRQATYQPHTQAYAVDDAPSYFAKKSNLFNVYFVKIGWVWITLAFFLFAFSHPSLGPSLDFTKITRRRAQATARYATVTLVWILVTQWCFGPPIIDRSFRWTGGKCQAIYSDSENAELEREKMGDVEMAFTHAACKAVGGRWAGGHDISGHVFLLILGSAMLWLELLPAVLKMEGLREARRILTSDGLVRSAAFSAVEQGESAGQKPNMDVPKKLGWGMKGSLTVAGLSWWMLLMTAAYFHTWFEKFTGLLVAFIAVYTVYLLPRAVPVWRKIVGLPGV